MEYRMAASNQHQRWLLELTALPTASGREDRVVQWVRDWARRRRHVEVRKDAHGNLVLQRRGARSRQPIFFTAHMDHPAFVAAKMIDERNLSAEFRGSVHEWFFVGSPVLLHHAGMKPQPGRIIAFDQRLAKDNFGGCDSEKQLVARFESDFTATPGDVLTWDTGAQKIESDRLRTPACDDLAGVAAALSAFDMVLAGRGKAKPDVRVLLTRAEEYGFVGAIAACKAGTMAKSSRLVALENSKSFPESPIGAGPIVRVGDYTSTFDPDLTYRVGRIAQKLAGDDPSFKFQRKLMPGGTCEASVYQSYGFTATCLCLPLGNYHNMNEVTGKIEAETISLSDYHGLIRLLVSVARTLDDPGRTPALRQRLEDLFVRRRAVLGG